MTIGPQVTATVTAVDHASDTLKRIAELARSVAKELDKGGSGALKSQLDLANGGARQHAESVHAITRAYQAAASAAKQLAGMAAVKASFAIEHGAVAAVKAGAHLQHEEINLRAAGVPQADIEAYKRQIVDLQRTIPGVSIEGGLELAKELRGVLLDVKEVPHILPSVMKARAAIEAGGGDASGLGQLVKAGELLGYAQDPEKFQRYLDALVRGQQVIGKLINPEGLFELAKYEKSSGRNLSERFQTTTAVSLAAELSGSTTGKALDQLMKQLLGANNVHAAFKEAVSLGLLRDSDVIKVPKTGEVKGLKPGASYAQSDLAQRDPDRWVWDVLEPALERHGFTTPEQQIAEVRKAFPNGNAADLINKLISQRESFQNHAKLYDQASGLNAADLYKSDALTAIKSLSTSLHDFGAVLAEPIMKDAAGVISSITAALSELKKQFVDWSSQYPLSAKFIALGLGGVGALGGAGGLIGSYKLLQGLLGSTALTGSATALDGSAAALVLAAKALEGAAAAQTAKSVGSKVVDEFRSNSAAAAAGGAAAGGGLAALVGSAAIGAVAFAIPKLSKSLFDTSHDIRQRENFASEWMEHHVLGGTHKSFGETFEHHRWPQIPASPSLPFFARSGQPTTPQQPPLKPVDVNVQGNVKGEVAIMNKISVEPSALLRAIVEDAKKATANVYGELNRLGHTATPDSGVVPAR